MELKYIAGEIPWTLPFGDHFYSTDLQRDNELEIIARRHGFEQLINLENKSNWSNTGVCFTNRTIDSNIIGNHLTDSYDDYNHTFCYLCSVNAHQHERTQPRDESQRRKLIPYKNPKARLSSSSLDRLGQHPSSDLISYRFIVRTGTEKNSGTRAQVFLYMYGTEKNWSSIHLQERLNTNSSASIDGFPSGSSRTFCLKGPDIGQLHHMNVNLVGSRSKKEWFLKDIEITNLKTSTSWLCEFNCWLPKADNQDIDQANMRIFPRHTDSPFTSKSLENYSIYILQVRTGDKALASTDTNIHITIRGSKNKSNRLRLSNDRVNLFEQNQLDTFAIVGEHLGDLLEISIESDKSQLASDWDIKELTMWKLLPANENDQSHVYFPINSWLGKKIPALKAKREVYPLVDPHLKGPICYQIIVKTGKVTNAGTDANVFLIIYGKSGRTAVHQLNNRSKNDFERNTSSEFTIMDIDIGEIDRIKIWHDNSNLNSAWFLDSIIIQKKYSTCHIISDIYIQRLEQISKAIDRRISEQRKKTRHESKSHSVDRQNSRVNDDVDQGSTDRLGNSRGILRSPTMYDRASLQKKVTWDEQSIGSLDDLYSMDSQRTKSLQNLNEQKYKKMESFQEQFHPNDYQIYWISSHNYRDNQWKIKSIEEIDPFDLEQSTRLSLLSDRSVINNKTKRPVRDNDDEIYEFQANRWLAKDKEDGKLEVYLTPKSIRRSSLTSDTNIDTKKKPPIPPSRHFDIPHSKHDHIEKDSKRLLSSDVGPIERSSRSQSSSLHSHSIAARQNSLLKQKEESSRDKFPLSSPLSSRAKSSPNVNNSMNALNDEQDLLARLTDEPSQHPRSSVSPLSPRNQRMKASRNINDQQSPAEISRKPLIQPRSSTSSLLTSSQNVKLSRSNDDRSTPLINSYNPTNKIPDDLPNYSQTTPRLSSSSNSRPKLSQDNKSSSRLPNTNQELLAKLTEDPIHSPRSSVTSVSTLNQHRTSSRIEDELPTYSRSITHSKLSSSPYIKPLQNNNNDLSTSLLNSQDSLDRTSRERSNYTRSTLAPMSSSHERIKSPRNHNELTRLQTNDQDLLHPRSSTTSLSPLNQRAKLTHPIDSFSLHSTEIERGTATKISTQSIIHPRSSNSSLFPSNQGHSNNEFTNSSSPRTAIGSPLRPKSARRSNPHFSSQQSIFDQVYHSAHSTAAASDDF